jgi:tRNA threonylcarbamoyladenosine biosynthesis protein TsaE
MISKSVEETQKFAYDLVSHSKGGEIFALSGDLGGGKTTFAQGLAKGLGIKEFVNSPTFVIIKEYQTKNKKFKNLIHIDLYRLKKIDEIMKKEILEYLTSNNVVVIEWAEKIRNILPTCTKWIKFEFVDENTRKIIAK